jgi:hypothetical protein
MGRAFNPIAYRSTVGRGLVPRPHPATSPAGDKPPPYNDAPITVPSVVRL